jgi:hypothetical protein
LFNAKCVCGHRLVKKPSKRNGSVEYERFQLRPSPIRALMLVLRVSFTRFRMLSMSANSYFTLTAGRAGTMTAASLPRRVIPILLPPLA